MTIKYNAEVFDYCSDHYKHFGYYPSDMEIYNKDGSVTYLGFNYMMLSLTNEQIEIIEKSFPNMT